MPVRLYSEARAEMLEAAAWYDEQEKGLGKRFLDTLQEVFGRIESNPRRYHIVEGDVRRCFANPFPFNILYRVQENRVYVMAIMHQSRRPGYWKNRKLQ